MARIGFSRYTELHQRGFVAAEAEPGVLAPVGAVPGHLAFSGARTFAGAKGKFGSAYVDIFAPGRRLKEGAAVGMVYCVGPLGVNKRAEGLEEPTAEREADVLKDKAEFLAYHFHPERLRTFVVFGPVRLPPGGTWRRRARTCSRP